MVVVYQPVLVLLSIGVAIIGSLAALALTARAQRADTGQRSFVLANGGLIMGATIWSMHFVAMMAVQFPLVVNYNLAETLISVGVAIAATGLGLYVASTNRLGAMSIPAGGLCMGLGIAGMHYLGMGAIRGCGLAYDLRLVAASVAIAIGASMAALWFTFYRRALWMTLAGGVVQGLAIASMHYTAMAATFFVPLGVEIQLSRPIFSQDFLAYVIAAGLSIIALGNLLMLMLIKHEPMTTEQIRLVQASFRRIEPTAPLVAEVFYRRLFEIAPHVHHRFPSDLTNQGAKLMAMMAIAIANLDNIEEIEPAIRELGRRHYEYGVLVEDYRPVCQALIWTLEQGLQAEFTPRVREAWLAAYAVLSDIMIAGSLEAEADAARSGLARPALHPAAA